VAEYFKRKEVLEQFEHASTKDFFCVDCFTVLEKDITKKYYCPNDMCKNDEAIKIKEVEEDGKGMVVGKD